MVYQNDNQQYTNAAAYDRRDEFSVLENYVLEFWQPFLKKIVRNLSIGKIIVDLGCGTCEYTQACEAAKKIYAVDISESMLKICRQKLEKFPQAEIINLPVKDFNLAGELADTIITIGVWEYIKPEELTETIKKITHRGSKVIVVFPNVYNKLNLLRSVVRMRKIAPTAGFIRKLFQNEFLILDQKSFGMVSWAPKRMQFLFLPIWKFGDWLWAPLQKIFPLGVNIYYLFERK